MSSRVTPAATIAMIVVTAILAGRATYDLILALGAVPMPDLAPVVRVAVAAAARPRNVIWPRAFLGLLAPLALAMTSVLLSLARTRWRFLGALALLVVYGAALSIYSIHP